MNPHEYADWGLGHMSHPDDPTTCCHLPKSHSIHQIQARLDYLDRLWPMTADPVARARIEKQREELRAHLTKKGSA